MTYAEFCARKAIRHRDYGLTGDISIHGRLFDFQRKATEYALRKGRCALFLDTGLGKTICQLEWARHIDGNVLIIAPPAVAPQTIREADTMLGMEVHHSRDGSFKGPVTITNYERLHHFDPTAFAGVVLDECFAAGTEVDVVGQGGELDRKHIEDIRCGDVICNASGYDVVADVHRREVQYAIKVTVRGSFFICSPNHPIFTQRGWTAAQCLLPGDKALVTREAMRLVREGICPEVSSATARKILRDVLLSEMEDESTGDIGEGSLSGSGNKTRKEAICMAQVRKPQGDCGDCEDSRIEPEPVARGSRENLPPIESHEARTFRAWGQWSRYDEGAIDASGCFRQRMDSGISFVIGSTATRVSNALQARLGDAGKKNRDRGGWVLTQGKEEGEGQEEGGKTAFVRVDSIEVLERGNPELEKFRDADGKLYFYDIGATRHPSFSVNGLLVHNSSILKSFTGKTKQSLCEAFGQTPYRLACTATPAPNDFEELGNHSEFLGVIPRTEMLARWFINDSSDTGTWRLKGHAVKPFWQWVGSWAVCAEKPSDLGGDDTPFILPPLQTRLSVVEEANRPSIDSGFLFTCAVISATGIHANKRATLKTRVNKARELAETGDYCIVWCETNEESSALAKAIPDAVEVVGSDDVDEKEAKLDAFSRGDERVMVTKASIAGFGLNWQHCAHQIFSSLSFSYESFYQAVRRSWRFGQKREVMVDVIISESEQTIWQTQKRKLEAHNQMKSAMRHATLTSENRAHADRLCVSPTVLPSWLAAK